MRIIIVGAGVVGYHLAERLSVEGHAISVVDARPELVRRIDEKMNVLAIAGNASTPTVLQRAKAENADLVIAVTNHDNTNLVVSLLAHRMGARKVVLRLRDDQIWMYGTPWHGDYDEIAPHGVPLRHIFCLHQAPEHRAKASGGAAAVSALLSRCFVPHWHAEGMARTLDFIDQVIARVPFSDLWFAPEPSVVEFVRCEASL